MALSGKLPFHYGSLILMSILLISLPACQQKQTGPSKANQAKMVKRLNTLKKDLEMLVILYAPEVFLFEKTSSIKNPEKQFIEEDAAIKTIVMKKFQQKENYYNRVATILIRGTSNYYIELPFLTYGNQLNSHIEKTEKAIRLSHKLNLCSDEFKKIKERYYVLLLFLQKCKSILSTNERYINECQRAV